MSDEEYLEEEDILEPNEDFEEGEGIDQGDPDQIVDYDEEKVKQADDAAFEAAINSGMVEANPDGAGQGRVDIAERLREREETGGGTAEAVPRSGVGQFSKLRGEQEPSDLEKRIAALEAGSAPQSRQAPLAMEPLPPLRYYIVQRYGGQFLMTAFRNRQAMNGYAQGLEGEKRMFAYRDMPEPEAIKAELVEINALGKVMKRTL